MSDLKLIAEQYFETFSRKDLGGLAVMFHKDVTLFDWEISAEGIHDVLAANQKIFDSVNTITVIPMDLYQDANVVVAELNIVVNGQEVMAVADVLTFEDDKIIMVRAYKG